MDDFDDKLREDALAGLDDIAAGRLTSAADLFGFDAGPTVGYCSKCGDVRSSFYTCRDGGTTVPKERDR